MIIVIFTKSATQHCILQKIFFVFTGGRVRGSNSNPFVRKLWHANDRPGNPLNGATALALLWGPPGGRSSTSRSPARSRSPADCHRDYLRERNARVKQSQPLMHTGRARVWRSGGSLRFEDSASERTLIMNG